MGGVVAREFRSVGELHPETTGELLLLLRRRAELDQVEIARRCGWTDASAVSRLETGVIRRPQRATLDKLAKALAGRKTGSVRQVRAWFEELSGW